LGAATVFFPRSPARTLPAHTVCVRLPPFFPGFMRVPFFADKDSFPWSRTSSVIVFSFLEGSARTPMAVPLPLRPAADRFFFLPPQEPGRYTFFSQALPGPVRARISFFFFHRNGYRSPPLFFSFERTVPFFSPTPRFPGFPPPYQRVAELLDMLGIPESRGERLCLPFPLRKSRASLQLVETSGFFFLHRKGTPS